MADVREREGREGREMDGGDDVGKRGRMNEGGRRGKGRDLHPGHMALTWILSLA